MIYLLYLDSRCFFINVEWKNIHVGISGRDIKTKICNTVIFVIKYIILGQGQGAPCLPIGIVFKG